MNDFSGDMTNNSWTNSRHSYGKSPPFDCVKCGEPWPYYGRDRHNPKGSRPKRPCPINSSNNTEDRK